MSSLTQISILSRKIIRYSIYTAVFIVIVRYSYLIGTKIYRKYYPAPPPDPTVPYEKLPKIPFPPNDKDISKDLVFTLETPTGKLPKLQTQMTVYFMPKAISTINSLDVAKQKAASLGYNPNGKDNIPTVYEFQHNTAPSTLVLNIVTGVFSISYDLNSKPTVLEGVPPDSKTATSLARSYLSRAKSLPEDLTGPVTTVYEKVQNGNIVTTSSLSDANITKINFYRKNYNDFPNVTPIKDQGNVWFEFSGAKTAGDQIIRAEYKYFPIDEDNNGTYPIITSDQAWEMLKSGNAYFSYIDEKSNGNIIVRKVYLAYYDPDIYSEFYQPVVVFEGDDNFTAFVPAVTSDYTQ